MAMCFIVTLQTRYIGFRWRFAWRRIIPLICTFWWTCRGPCEATRRISSHCQIASVGLKNIPHFNWQQPMLFCRNLQSLTSDIKLVHIIVAISRQWKRKNCEHYSRLGMSLEISSTYIGKNRAFMLRTHGVKGWIGSWHLRSLQAMRCCGPLGLVSLKPKLHYFDLWWICCTTNPRQIEVIEF